MSEMRTREKTRRNRMKRSANYYVSRRNTNGETRLHVACREGNIEEVTTLLESNHTTRVQDYYGWTPLHEAANHGHDDIAELLIKYGANVDDPGGPMCGGVTPLHGAASRGHLSMMLLLIKSGADVQAKTIKGQTILDCLENWKNSSGDLSRGEQVDYDNMLSKLSTLLEPRAQKSSLSIDNGHNGASSSCEMTKRRRINDIDILPSTREAHSPLSDSAPPNCLHSEMERSEASELEDDELEDARKIEEKLGARAGAVEEMAESSENESECSTMIADPNTGNPLALKTEMETQQEPERSCNNFKLEMNACGKTELHVACGAGNIEEVTKLLESNYPTDVQDYCGWTPLHEAANHGHVEIAKLLIKSGANVNDPGGQMCGGVTALHVAASYGHFSMVRLLIKSGADLRAKTRDDLTILGCFEAWKKCYGDLSREEQGVYDTLLAKLSVVLQKSAEEPQRDVPPQDWSPETSTSDEDRCQTSDNVKRRLRRNNGRKTRDANSKYHSKQGGAGSSVENDGMKRNMKGETRLHLACIAGNIERVKKLLECNHPTDVRDNYGWTPLQEAANHGHVEIAELLIEHGANVDDPGGPMCEGLTPLHDAAEWGHFSMMYLLIKKGANLHAQTRDGHTILDRLEAWKKNSKDTSLRKQAQYESLHSILSAACCATNLL